MLRLCRIKYFITENFMNNGPNMIHMVQKKKQSVYK